MGRVVARGGKKFPGITSYCWWQPEIRGSTHQLKLVIPWFARFFLHPKGGCFGFLPSTVPYLSEAGSTVSTTILLTRSNRDQRSSGPGRATLLALFPWLVGKLFQLKKKNWSLPHTMKVAQTSSLVVTCYPIYISNPHTSWMILLRWRKHVDPFGSTAKCRSLRLHHLHVEACETWDAGG